MPFSIISEVAGLRAGLAGLVSTEQQIEMAQARRDEDEVHCLHRVADQQREALVERLKLVEQAGGLEYLGLMLAQYDVIDTAAPCGPREVSHG